MTEEEMKVFNQILRLNKIELGMLLTHLEDKIRHAGYPDYKKYIATIGLVARRFKELKNDNS